MSKPLKQYRILVIGGYGTFGRNLCIALTKEPDITVIVAGRHIKQAHRFAESLNLTVGRKATEAAELDIESRDLMERIKAVQPDLVIHTSGPFQGQPYWVPEACIYAGVHYIDLADDRGYVLGIEHLSETAKDHGVMLISGVSTVPALSSAVIDHYFRQFSSLDTIDCGITPGNLAARGNATLKAVLSYVGRPFLTWKDKQWQRIYGWQNVRSFKMAKPVGRRWFANCDIPDLSLFPKRYPGVQNVFFGGSLELKSLYFSLWGLSWLSRFHLVSNWAGHSGFLNRLAHCFDRFGTNHGGMYIKLTGQSKNKKLLTVTWQIIAENGKGHPIIPIIPTLTLAKKIKAGRIVNVGAVACVGLMSLTELMAEIDHPEIRQVEDVVEV